jgi:hypothetical protein
MLDEPVELEVPLPVVPVVDEPVVDDPVDPPMVAPEKPAESADVAPTVELGEPVDPAAEEPPMLDCMPEAEPRLDPAPLVFSPPSG